MPDRGRDRGPRTYPLAIQGQSVAFVKSLPDGWFQASARCVVCYGKRPVQSGTAKFVAGGRDLSEGSPITVGGVVSCDDIRLDRRTLIAVEVSCPGERKIFALDWVDAPKAKRRVIYLGTYPTHDPNKVRVFLRRDKDGSPEVGAISAFDFRRVRGKLIRDLQTWTQDKSDESIWVDFELLDSARTLEFFLPDQPENKEARVRVDIPRKEKKKEDTLPVPAVKQVPRVRPGEEAGKRFYNSMKRALGGSVKEERDGG